jgi:hypothetical protein
VTGPPAVKIATVSGQIREQQLAALKFRSEYIDVLENNRRVEVIGQAEARRRLRVGGYEAIGNNTVKYLRRIPYGGGSIDGPVRKQPPRAADNFTIDRTRGTEYHHRFRVRTHPWAKASFAGRLQNS